MSAWLCADLQYRTLPGGHLDRSYHPYLGILNLYQLPEALLPNPIGLRRQSVKEMRINSWNTGVITVS